MGVNSLPKIITRQRRSCDLNPGPSAPESRTLTTRLANYYIRIVYFTARAEYRLRCPDGTKTKLYKRARLDKFADYVLKDGLVCRLSVYYYYY